MRLPNSRMSQDVITTPTIQPGGCLPTVRNAGREKCEGWPFHRRDEILVIVP